MGFPRFFCEIFQEFLSYGFFFSIPLSGNTNFILFLNFFLTKSDLECVVLQIPFADFFFLIKFLSRMLRDFKFLRRNSAKNEEAENIPANRKDLSGVRISSDSSRAPLNAIQEPPPPNPKPEQDVSIRSKVDKTPVKAKAKASDHPALPLRTPDKHGGATLAKNRFGWAQKNEAGSANTDDFGSYSARGAGMGNGGFPNMTPRQTRTVGRAAPSFSESNSTQSTPTKSVSKPPSSTLRNKADGTISARTGNYAALYKGLPMSAGSSSTVVNTVEVPHFNLKEDPSFWMEHNVQVKFAFRFSLILVQRFFELDVDLF